MRIGRGHIQGDVASRSSLSTYRRSGSTSRRRWSDREARIAFRPDRVWIADGVHLKPDLILSLARHRPIVRLYAYEMLCARRYGVLFRKGARCEGIDRLDGANTTWALCRACALGDFRLCAVPRSCMKLLSARPGVSRTVRRSSRACCGLDGDRLQRRGAATGAAFQPGYPRRSVRRRHQVDMHGSAACERIGRRPDGPAGARTAQRFR